MMDMIDEMSDDIPLTAIPDDTPISRLLEKMRNSDKDFRYMAINDMMIALDNGTISLDEITGKEVCRQLLVMIEDKSSEVQNMVIKCLGSIEHHLPSYPFVFLLCQIPNFIRNSVSHPAAQIYTRALKEILKYADPRKPPTGEALLEHVVPDLNIVLKDLKALIPVHLDVIEIMGEITRRFAPYILLHHETVGIRMLDFVNGHDSAARKRAITALGHLLAVGSQKLYRELMRRLVISVSKEKDSTILCSKVAFFSFAAKGKPVAFEKHLDTVVPLVLRILDETEDEELMEAVLQNIEAFVSNCAVQKFIPTLVGVLMKALAYDPNYNYAEEEEGDDSESLYSDDDEIDLSWRVRRSAAKALHSLIVGQRYMAPQFLQSLGTVLVTRFSEREDAGLCEILLAYTHLIRGIHFSSETPNAPVDEALRSQLNTILKRTTGILAREELVVRSLFFDLLSQFCKTLPHCLSGHMNVVLFAMRTGLQDENCHTQRKVDALRFFKAVVDSHRKEDFMDVGGVVQLLLSAVADPSHEVSTYAVQVIHKFAAFLELGRDDQLIRNILASINHKLSSGKIEEEFRDRAVSCVGHVLSLFGRIETPDILDSVRLLVSCAIPDHDVCRVALLALVEVTKSPSKEVLDHRVDEIVDLCCLHLKKEARDSKVVAMDLLTGVVEAHLIHDCSVRLISLLHGFMTESDLEMAQMAMNCLSGIYAIFPGLSSWHATVDALVNLLTSSLVQGPTLTSLVGLARTLAKSAVSPTPIDCIVDKITLPVYEEAPLPRLAALSMAVVTGEMVALGQKLGKTRHRVKEWMEDCLGEGLSIPNRCFCLLALGEIGRRFPLVYERRGGVKVDDMLVSVLSSKHEDLRWAAAQAFGALAAGQPNLFLPIIVKEIQSSDRHNCLLRSIKEVICCAGSSSVLKKALPVIWKHLVSLADCADEGVRLLVAECLARSCLINDQFVPQLLAFITNSRSTMRHCALSAFKFIVSSQEAAFLNENNIEKLLSAVEDADLVVRRAFLDVLDALIHRRTSLVTNFLPRVLPLVYENLKVREDLITVVERGPFKHEVDGGIDIRMAGFQILHSLMEKCPQAVDVDTYILYLKGGPPSGEGLNAKFSGIQDDCLDVRTLSHLLLARLLELYPTEVLDRVRDLSSGLYKTFDEGIKDTSVREDAERLGELKKTAIRLVLNMNNLPGAERELSLQDLVNYIGIQKQVVDHWPGEFQKPPFYRF